MKLALACSIALACGSTGFPPDAVATLRGAIDDLRNEEQAHHTAVDAAPSVEAILALESDHGLRVGEDTRAIRATLDRLAFCMHFGNRWPLGPVSMHDALQDVRLDYDAHEIRLRTAGDRAAMTNEEDRYSRAMRDALDELDAQMSALLEHQSDVEKCR